ncbi:MAG: DoxX family protein [Campylobacterales bacterium]|nr:DoxX family protein [Campylobacterales bacterium]
MRFLDDDLAKLILRLGVGGLMLFHGFYKVIHGIGGVKALVVKAGLPEVVAYGVYAGELIAPLLLILGIYSRASAGIVAFTMAGAIYFAHADALLALGKHGAPVIELPLLYLLGALCIMLLGPGCYGINAR